jgi:hypothetical protein
MAVDDGASMLLLVGVVTNKSSAGSFSCLSTFKSTRKLSEHIKVSRVEPNSQASTVYHFLIIKSSSRNYIDRNKFLRLLAHIFFRFVCSRRTRSQVDDKSIFPML